jgi:hypothetical protein
MLVDVTIYKPEFYSSPTFSTPPLLAWLTRRAKSSEFVVFIKGRVSKSAVNSSTVRLFNNVVGYRILSLAMEPALLSQNDTN